MTVLTDCHLQSNKTITKVFLTVLYMGYTIEYLCKVFLFTMGGFAVLFFVIPPLVNDGIGFLIIVLK